MEEESEGWELALIGAVGNLDLELIWFDQDIDNEIIFDLAGYSGYLQTTGTSQSEGLEIIASLPLSERWRIEGNFTSLDATQQNGDDRAYRPDQTGQVSIVWTRNDVRARVTGRYTGEATDPFMTSIDDTFTIDLSAQWDLSNRWALEARVLNVTDHDDQQLPGYYVPGMTAYAGVRVKLYEHSMDRNTKHNKAMAKQKAAVDEGIAKADVERGVSVLLTGDGKGKTSSAFGMVMRALGYGQKIGVVQFIKGVQASGEEHFVRDHLPGVDLHQMGTGFTWDTQDRESDIAAARRTWEHAVAMLGDASYDLVVLDELTYMLAFDYLPEDEVISALTGRPESQSVVVTGRGGGQALREAMDTVSEVKEVKHAYRAGIRAREKVS